MVSTPTDDQLAFPFPTFPSGVDPETTRLIQLGGRLAPVRGYALVDVEDYDWLSQWHWHILSAGRFRYAARSTKRNRQQQTFLLHREILGLAHGDLRRGDHINGETFDNRRSNLRIVTPAQNSQNLAHRPGGTSRYRGVSWSTRDKRWVARVNVKGKVYALGNYKDETEAARLVEEARARLYEGYISREPVA